MSHRDRPARGVLALGVAVATIIAAAFAVPQWLTPEDPVERCAALVVLNGDYPWRADEAARLYHAGVAPEIWLTIDPRSGTRGSDSGTSSNAAHLAGRGVPSGAVHIVSGTALGTRAELSAVRTEAVRRAAECVVVVTSPLHARRVKLTWRAEVAPATPRLVVRHAAKADYAGWRTMSREFVLSVGALLGYPR